MTLPITDLIVAAVSKMVDDSQSDHYREPSHSDLEFYIGRAGLTQADPKAQGQTVGKAKRIRAVLSWAINNDPAAGGKLIESLVSKIRASGGFRPSSENYIGEDVIRNGPRILDSRLSVFCPPILRPDHAATGHSTLPS